LQAAGGTATARYKVGKLKKRWPTTNSGQWELEIIQQSSIQAYPNRWDFISYAREHKIPVGPVAWMRRGVAGFHALAITISTPQHEILFERF